MKKKFYLILALAIALAVSGGTYVYTYTTASVTIGVTAAEGDIATVEPAPAGDQPDWGSVLQDEELASDDFESGGWSGGSGWLYEWWHSGDASITTSGTPHGGSYHLMLRRDDGYVDRAVNLAGQTKVWLQFWAKADSFEAGEFAECLVSPDGTSWTTVKTWVDGEDDNIYRFYDIDLSGFTMSSEFWIAFDAEMSGTGDYLYIDDLAVVSVGGRGDVPSGDLFEIAVNESYTGDLLVKVYLTNTAALVRAYQYLNMELYLEGSVEADETPNYRVLTLDNGVATFNLESSPGVTRTLQLIGGGYNLIPGDWEVEDITPELYCEATQR